MHELNFNYLKMNKGIQREQNNAGYQEGFKFFANLSTNFEKVF